MISFDELMANIEKSYTRDCETAKSMVHVETKRNPLTGAVDMVIKPEHYNTGSIEAWDYILDSLGKEGFVYYCEGNVKKYLHRWRYKGTPSDDLRKARAYLDRMIELTD